MQTEGPDKFQTQVEQLVDLTSRLKIEAHTLDELIHECKGHEAAEINNEGVEAQVEYIVGWFGYEEAKAQLEQFREL